jgi:sucrose-6-phosphatase
MGASTKLELIITDLDNTLVGDDRALSELNQILETCRQDWGTKIVYATGRSLTSYQQLATEKDLLIPDAKIVAVGTEIYLDRDLEPDRGWVSILSPGWDREAIVNIANHFADLEPQPESEQRPFKISYYLSPTVVSDVLLQLEALLAEQGMNVEAIYSGNKDLDLIPKGGNKGAAVQFLRQQWDISPLNTAVCGDSGNDIALFDYGFERGIIVGNAQPELKTWLEVNGAERHYLANAYYAAGILEGLCYFRLIDKG